MLRIGTQHRVSAGTAPFLSYRSSRWIRNGELEMDGSEFLLFLFQDPLQNIKYGFGTCAFSFRMEQVEHQNNLPLKPELWIRIHWIRTGYGFGSSIPSESGSNLDPEFWIFDDQKLKKKKLQLKFFFHIFFWSKIFIKNCNLPSKRVISSPFLHFSSFFSQISYGDP